MANDFNRELDRYLDDRTSEKDWSHLMKPRKKPTDEEKVPEDLKTDEVRVLEDDSPSFWERIFGRKEPVSEDLSPEEMAKLEGMQHDIEEIEEREQTHPEEFDELEERRESLLERFFAFFRVAQHRHRLDKREEELAYIEKEVIPQMDEDVKQVLKIVHKWLERLSKKEKAAFKKSGDFASYKALLEKYGVAKVQKADEKK